MGKRYERSRRNVSENKHEIERINTDRTTLNNEYSPFYAVIGLMESLDDEVIDSVQQVELVGESEAERLDRENEEARKENKEINEEIDAELAKLNAGLAKLSQLDKYEYGKQARDKGISDYKKEIEKFKALKNELAKLAGTETIASVNEFAPNGHIQEVQLNEAERNENIYNGSEGVNVSAGYIDFSENSTYKKMNSGHVNGQNFNPTQDVKNAFEFAEENYERTSMHWQEVANRQIESINFELSRISVELDAVREAEQNTYSKIQNYLGESELSRDAAATDLKYQDLLNEYRTATEKRSALEGEQRRYQMQVDEITSNIIPEMKTTYYGMSGSNFNDSYNDFITERQGQAVDNFGGVCGINETCSIVNQQTGSNLGEAEGISEYVTNGWCTTGKSYESNGGTNSVQRSLFLDSKGLTFQRIDTTMTGVEISLDDIAQRHRNGESIGIMLKAQDLSQAELSSRKINPMDKRTWNSKYANHATTVAGFSYRSNGDVAGVWINDTGGFAGSNRVYIEKEKFMSMQRATKGFAIEFSRKR